MKARQSISKPVLAFVLAGLAVSVAFVWLLLSRNQQKPSDTASSPVEAVEPVPAVRTQEAEISPGAVASAKSEGGLPPVIPVSLRSVPKANGDWLTSRAFLAFPRGTQSFGGIEFWLDGVVILQCQAGINNKQDYPLSVAVPLTKSDVFARNRVQLGSNVASIHLVGATHFHNEGNLPVANLVWHYADGSSQQTPIQSNYHVRDYLRTPYETPAFLSYPFTKAVWRSESVNQPGRMARLYRMSLPNPEPSKVIRQLEFVSTLQVPQLFVLGLTLDPLLLGERPDDSPNLEPTDAAAPAHLDVYVQNAEGQRLPKVTVHLRIQQYQEPHSRRYDQSVETDNLGIARFNYPLPAKSDRIELGAMHDDYGGRKMSWSFDAGDVVPATWNFTMGAGVKIGGTVVDPSEVGIKGATISMHRFWSGGDEMNRKGEQPDVPNRTVTTGAQGEWQLKGLPAELLDRIGVDIKHTDYMGVNFTVGADDNSIKQLRAGTFKTVLRKGVEVPGRVTDEADLPIAGATVWAGGRYTRERQNKKTDAEGRFNFRNVNEGDLQFSVAAKGKKPESKTVAVKSGMEEIVFKLGPGQLIRALVQNESAEPLPGTRVSLESRSGGVAEAFEFSTTTGQDGRFEWDGAPDEPSRFYFYKAGYEQKRSQMLEVGKENVVTLRKARQVKGWVLDATTQRPITKFRVGVGNYHGLDHFYPSRGMKDYTDANGIFTLELDDEQQGGIKAEADDYAEKVEKLPAAQDGVIQVVLHLKPSPAVHGVLLSPEGTPVPGGTVGLTGGGAGGMGVSLRNGRLVSYGSSQRKVVTTDANGEFTLPSPPEAGLVVGAGEMGFAMSPIQQVRDSGWLVLQAFGQIEGTFKVGGQPVAGQEFMFSMMNVGLSFDFGSYKAASDESGRFIINKVPPGEGQIVRLIKMGGGWRHSHNTDVVIQPGQVTQVALGDSGAVLKGRVTFETPPVEGEKLTLSGTMNTTMPEQPPSFANAEAAQAFFNSPEWRAKVKQAKHFGVTVNADGSLMLDSIPAGNYTLNVSASKPGGQPWESTPVAQGQTTVVVPENASPYQPIYIGDIILKPAPQRKTGPVVPR